MTVNHGVLGSSPRLGAIFFGPLEKRLNSHAFHACIHGFESRTGHHNLNIKIQSFDCIFLYGIIIVINLSTGGNIMFGFELFSFNGLLGLVWLVLVIYTLYVLLTGKNPKKLSKLVWVILILILPYIGVILYWILEKKILG